MTAKRLFRSQDAFTFEWHTRGMSGHPGVTDSRATKELRVVTITLSENTSTVYVSRANATEGAPTRVEFHEAEPSEVETHEAADSES